MTPKDDPKRWLQGTCQQSLGTQSLKYRSDVDTLRLCLYRGTISYFSNLVRMISVIDGSPRGYDFCITVQRFKTLDSVLKS